MIRKELNRFEYIHLTKGSKTFYVEIFKGKYQKLKVGDKVLCSFDNEEIEAYVIKLIYVPPGKEIIENIVFEEEKYGKLHVYLSLNPININNDFFVEEYFEYKKLLEESKRCNFDILSRKIPNDISKTKICMPIKILNPLLIDNVLTDLFDVPIKLLSSLMKQALVVDTMDDEFITRRSVKFEEGYCLTGLEAVLYLYNKKKVHHPLLKEEDIFVDEIYIYPQYWERMYVQDNEENMISFSYLSLVNRCKFITMLKNDETAPKLVLENEKRMLFEKNMYLVERFINDELLIKR